MTTNKTPGPFRWDHRAPCGDCPYRLDAPRGLWHRDEFTQLVAKDRDPIGSIYGCHKQNGRGCVGWLLNQRARNLPSIALRLALVRGDDAARELHGCIEEAHDGGHGLFESIESMCRANGVAVEDPPPDPYFVPLAARRRRRR